MSASSGVYFERYGLLSRRPSNQHCQLATVETEKGESEGR